MLWFIPDPKTGIFRRYLLRAGLSFTLALLLLPVCGETEHVLFYSDPFSFLPTGWPDKF